MKRGFNDAFGEENLDVFDSEVRQQSVISQLRTIKEFTEIISDSLSAGLSGM
jgi:hypothetical protein